MVELPSINQYLSSLSAISKTTRTLGDFEVEKDMYGEIKFRSGNNAVVFKIRKDGKQMMLKCYFKHHRDLSYIYDYLNNIQDPLLHHAELLKNELFVFGHLGDGQHFDVVVAEWVDGNTLETEIKRCGAEYGSKGFARLSETFDKMALELLRRDWAHGDLKPENIIVHENGNMSLIDYDAMYIPGTNNVSSFEIGTPGYQHPLRDAKSYDKDIDDYAIALISASLKALEYSPELYDNYHRSDIIIMHPEEILNGNSEAYGKVLDILYREGCHYHYALAKKLKTPSPYIEGVLDLLGHINNIPQNQSISEPSGIFPILFTENGLWGYKETTGKTIIEAIYDEGTDFKDGLAVVRIKNTFQVIDTEGKVIINGIDYQAIKPFSENRAAVCKNNKWAFINRNGKLVCDFIFDNAGSVHNNRASIKIANSWGYADKNGNIIIEPQYEAVTGYRKGKATVYKRGKLFKIDERGDIIEKD